MKLPSLLEKLKDLGLKIPDLRRAILERRRIIRYHRDQKMDDRCWLDDFPLWAMLEYAVTVPTILPPTLDEMIQECTRFFHHRRADEPDPTPDTALIDPAVWNYDLALMDKPALLAELQRIQNAIRLHYDIWDRPRTLADDRALYAVLPEKIPADFRLPERGSFLGDDKAPTAGCPSFWRSHKQCQGTCSLSKWGPCSKAVAP